MNNAFIAGHLGADPETRFTSGGQKVTTLRVAAKVRRGGKDDTIWWRVTLWGDQFDKIMPHFKKGSSIMVNGELAKPEIYNDREGNPQVSMNITAFSIHFSPFGKVERDQAPVQQSTQKMAQAAAPAAPAASSYMQPGAPADTNSSSFDDEVPF